MERMHYIRLVFVLTALVMLGRIFYIQVLDPKYKELADATAIRKKTIFPARGEIFDRNGELLVSNVPVYDLMVTYNQVSPNIDTTKFCEILGITKTYFEEALNKNWKSRRYSKSRPFLFLGKINAETYSRFQESLYEFQGFYVQARSVRAYNHSNAAHILGALREVNAKEVKDSIGYKGGDYIGANGLERQYEYYLKGQKGKEHAWRNSTGKELGSYENGKLDKSPISGWNLNTTIDVELQAYAEELMKNKGGSIVAIEPATGEILTMLSAPDYDPNLLVIGQKRGDAFKALNADKNNPFLNRATFAQYPPGSLFKPIVALIAQQEGFLDPNRRIECKGAYYYKDQRLTGCHAHPPCKNVQIAIQHSCNAYFITIFREILDRYSYLEPGKGLDDFNEYLERFGIGKKLGLDIPGEKKGNYPTAAYFDKVFSQDRYWYSLWVRSLGIGQGELLMTNVQMANMAATLANRGWYYPPHLVRELENVDEGIKRKTNFGERQETGIDKHHFEPVIEGMEWVVSAGTAMNSIIPGIAMCGKTGTAENNQGNKIDHSVFFAFAPKDNPKIAIAVYVENGGYGNTYAAPIASLVIEKYLKGTIDDPYRQYLEKRMMDAKLLNLPPRKPRPIVVLPTPVDSLVN